MSKKPIIIVPHPVLREQARPIEKIDVEVLRTLDDMADTLSASQSGVGIAGNQIGVARRLIVLDTGKVFDKGQSEFQKLINPQVVFRSEDLSSYHEGCLSIPDQFADVMRPARVRVAYLDEAGKNQEIETDHPLYSHLLQHEIDHLNGVLFIDYLSALKRNIILRKVKKLTRDDIATVM